MADKKILNPILIERLTELTQRGMTKSDMARVAGDYSTIRKRLVQKEL
jgi:hypothetical protein